MKIPFEPNFKKGGGLITAVVQDIHSNEVIMLAYMNEEAYQKTLETGEAHYYSRSKQRLWHKGETSGHIQNGIVSYCFKQLRHPTLIYKK